MNPIKLSPILRLFAAALVTAVTVAISALAMHTPTQIQNAVSLKNIQTDRAVTFYADQRTNHGAWFVEMVLPTGDYADSRANHGAWFVEMVLPTGDSNMASENLKSVAATL